MTAGGLGANLGGVALFALPGLGVAELFAPLARMPWWRRLGYAYLLGVATVAGSLFALSHWLGVPVRRPAIACAVMAPVAVGLVARVLRRRVRAGGARASAPGGPGQGRSWRDLWNRRDRRDPRDWRVLRDWRVRHGRRDRLDGRHWRGWRHWRRAAVVLIALVCLGTLASALSVPLADWDGRMTWSVLASYLRQEATVDPAVLREPRWFVVHPQYPPLLPLAQAAVQETFGAGLDEQLYRAFYAGFLGAMLLVIRDGAGRMAGAGAAMLTVLCVALPHFLSYGSGGAISAYSDLPLACFYGAALVLLLLGPRRPSCGLAAGCLLAGAVWSKNEGEMLAAIALALGATRLLGRPIAVRRLGWFAATALPVLTAATLLAAWRAAIPNRFDEDYFAVVRFSALLRGAVTNLPEIVRQLLRLTFRWSDWQGFWVVVVVVLIAGLPALRRPGASRLLLAGLAPFAIAWAAYAVTTPVSRLPAFISQTWPRFLIQSLVPLAVVFAAALRHLLGQLRPIVRPPAVNAEEAA